MGAATSLNILVVDDDVRILGSLEDFLAGEGHRILTATRGQEAVALVERSRRENLSFELSILDVHVPDMSGLETYERLTDLVPGLGAIFITGDFSNALEHTARDAGAFAVFPKPVDILRLRRAISDYRGLLERSQLAGGFRFGRVREKRDRRSSEGGAEGRKPFDWRGGRPRRGGRRGDRDG